MCFNFSYCYPISKVSVNQLPVMPTTYKALICQHLIIERVQILQLVSQQQCSVQYQYKLLQLNNIIIIITIIIIAKKLQMFLFS